MSGMLWADGPTPSGFLVDVALDPENGDVAQVWVGETVVAEVRLRPDPLMPWQRAVVDPPAGHGREGWDVTLYEEER